MNYIYNGEFVEELMKLINKYSQENLSDTPDFILRDYLVNCLDAFNKATFERDKFYNVRLSPNHKYFNRFEIENVKKQGD
jgi:hypothetical protein